MTEMTRFPRHFIASWGRCVNMVFRANDKVLIKSLYQSATELVQTFDKNFIVNTKKHVYTTLPWRYNSDVENRHFRHFTSKHYKVSKSEVLEKVIPAADFWTSANDMCQKL